ncbi:hypothetical protein [Desulfomonile tiedjei]|uniref:Uncharacterized protein n=1 Tax=Desulfomonile tiedjei (strain ATCC 49306 / DSM 6799 / DCB-1) TaxID=706587 RepID=I4CAC8_DESTA|nr:hypothetical protein [Desulfomonile tiedjei]AFM26519.1 hypothetical protein Desti_3877 [Desulfomonile tiedjei DSM 6799]
MIITRKLGFLCPVSRAFRASDHGYFCFLVVILVLMFGCSVVFGAPPQKPQPQRNNQEEAVAPPGTIGDSGYVVPIPEIKMRSITGGPPRKTPPPELPAAPESSEPARREKQIEAPAPEGPVAVPPAEKLTPPKEPVTREKPAETAAPPKPQPPVEQQRDPVHIPESPQSAPAGPVESPSTSPETTRLPFEPSVRQPRESGPVKMPREVPQTEQRQEEKELDDEAPPISTPQAPEEIMTAPAPKKEVLKKRTEPIQVPALMENRPAKNPLTTIPIERMRVKESDTESVISLDSRKEPETLPDPEPASTEPAHPEPPTTKPIEQLPVKQPEPSPIKQTEPPKETVPPSPAVQPEEQKEIVPTETLPQPEEPAPAVGKEEPIRSPLDSDAGNGREVREYLKKTAPILEEVSILMTRAPSLSLADYDPSDPGAPLIPQELLLKMDSMKRELQILDSKTFAIIPPPQYTKFHGLIREAITRTHQACDAVYAYLKESNPENLQKIRDSLGKARELIQRTRTPEN